MATAKTVEDYLKKNGINLGAKVGGVELQGMEAAGLSPEDVKKYIQKAGLTFAGNAEKYLNNTYTSSVSAETNNVSSDDFGIKNDNVAQGISGLDNALEYILNTPHKEGSTGAALKNEFIGNVASKFLDTQYRQSNADADASRGLFVRDAELTQDRADYLQRSEYDALFNALNQSNEFTLQNQFEFNRAEERLTELGLKADLEGNLRKIDGDQNRLTQDNAARNQIDLAGVQGVIAKDYMLQELKAAGVEDRDLQQLVVDGELAKILERGRIETDIVGLNNDAQLIRLNNELASNERLVGLKGAEAVKQIKEELTLAGFNEQALQGLQTTGAIKQIAEQGRVDGELLQKGGIEDRKLQELVDSGALDRLNVEMGNNVTIQSMVGAQAKDQLLTELRESGINERKLEGLRQSGVIDQILEKGSIDSRLLKEGGIEDRSLQALVDSGALDRLNAEISSNETLQRMKGRQAILQIETELSKIGVNEQDLERLKNTGVLKQIATQGKVDETLLRQTGIQEKDLQKLIGNQKFKELQANIFSNEKIQSMVDRAEMERLEKAGEQSIEQIGAEGDVQLDVLEKQGEIDVSKIGATSVADQARIITQSEADERLIKAQTLADTTLENIKSTNRQSETSLAGDIESRQIQERGDVEESRISAQGLVDKTIQGMVGDQAVEQIGAKGDQDVRKTKVAGDDTRKTLELENKLKSKDRANQSSYARNLAGMM
jgi:hypothetical protein